MNDQPKPTTLPRLPTKPVVHTPTSLLERLAELRAQRIKADSLTIAGIKKDSSLSWSYPAGVMDNDSGDEHRAPITVKIGDRTINITRDEVPEGIKDEYTLDSDADEHAPQKGQFSGHIVLNDKQKYGVQLATDFSTREFVIIGSAGTGKTTMLRAAFSEVAPLVPVYGESHKHLNSSKPAIVVCSYTRRAVRNLKRSLQSIGAADNCITIHKLLEYAPEFYTELNEEGEPIEKMRFSPSRHAHNKLTGIKLIIIDEAGMCSVPLYQEILAAAPPDCRFIFLGDIYQLPPIYGSAILGYKLADAAASRIPLVELTHVYRQALESPILRYAIQVKDGRCPDFSEERCRVPHQWSSPDGKSHLYTMPIKEESRDAEFLNHKFGQIFARSLANGRFDPEQDVVLIPHGKPHTFGSHQISLHIAQAISDRDGLDIHEVIAGFNKHYLCIGDRVAVGSIEGRITEINRNAKYFGKYPRPACKTIDRWGRGKASIDMTKVSLDHEVTTLKTVEQVDAFLEKDRVEDRKAQASHVITIQLEDSADTVSFSTAGELNALAFTYALTVHRAQGAEWRTVYLLLHHIHAGMYSRELLYTAMTRARENLFIIARPAALSKCIERACIKGRTLAEKAEFFKGKKEEKERQLSLLGSLQALDLGAAE